MNAPRQANSVYTAHDLMREILQMTTQRWCEPERFSKIANDAGIRSVDARIFFLTQLREKVRLMPIKLFSSSESRDKMLESLQSAIDHEISREEVA